jgi:aspartyl-tRNA(Asn)/glutamyl-tRNA(Gln) amidotransferase subunit A
LPRTVFEALWVTGRGHGFKDTIARHRAEMDSGLVRCADLAASYTLPDYFKALDDRRLFTASVFAVFDQVDVMIMPTMPLTAFAAEDEVQKGGEADAALPWVTWTPYTYPFNLTGQPAVTIPCGLAGGMPVGLQVVGAWGHDELVLAVSARLERALAPHLGAFRPALVESLLGKSPE